MTSLRPHLFLLFFLSLFIPAAPAAPEALEIGPANKDQLPRGKEADGIIGDFLLRNDKIEAVISANLPLRRANMSTFYGANNTTPGCLYDLTLRGANNDQITIFAPANQQGPVSYVRIVKDGSDGEALIETVVTAANNAGLLRRHEYRTRDGWQGLLITTTFRNESAAPIRVPTTDKWTNFKRTGTALGIVWADAIDPADHAGYAFGITDGKFETGAGSTLLLPPGAETTYSRFLAVATSPVEAVGLVAQQRRTPVSLVQGTLKDSQGAPVTTAQLGVRVAGEFSRTVGFAYPDNLGHFSFALPDGKYELSIEDRGRDTVNRLFTIDSNETQTLDATMSPAAAIQFDIHDDLGRSTPCKAQFHALEGTEWPYLGPDNRAHGCIDQYHSETGKFRVALAPGKYRVVVTRGIEYSHLERTVTLAPGQATPFAGTLKRLVDTTGYVSADYHNHSTPSGDNTCGTDDRIINLAAEGVEFAPTTEHNRLYDWAPHIQRLGLAEYLQTVPGMELTGNGAHLNSFPFKPEPQTQDNGAPVWNKDPRISVITLRDWQGAEPDRWIQINHPDMVEDFIDRNADGLPDGGFHGLATLIDGLETQNYSTSELHGGRPFRIYLDRLDKENVFYLREFIWLQLLNMGHTYAAMAVCDAHTVWGNGVGSWRMYMPSTTDDPAKIDWRENSRHAKAGHSYLTTGPFLTVRTDTGAGPGDTTRATSSVKLAIKVQCTDWIDIDRVQILVNGRPRPTLNFTRAKNPQMFATPANTPNVVKFDRTIEVPLTEDAHLIVVATGETTTLTTGYGTSWQSKIHPTAYHNPIFVDIDGHGFQPNGDTLDWPLTVKKIDIPTAKKLLEDHHLPSAAISDDF